MSKKMMDFVATNEVLNDLGTTLKNMFADDPIFGHGQGFKDLTEKTYNVMCHMDAALDSLKADQGINRTAEMFGVTKESVMEDVIKVMMYSTIARQALTIDMLTKLLEEENE